jgi:hypothetical protein
MADAALLDKLKGCKEWSRALIFNEKGDVLATTCTPAEGEVQALLSAFKVRLRSWSLANRAEGL